MSDWSKLWQGSCPLCGDSLVQVTDHVTCERCSFAMPAASFFAKVKKDRIGHWSVKHRHVSEEEKMIDALG